MRLRSSWIIGLLIALILLMLSTMGSYEPEGSVVAVIPIDGVISVSSDSSLFANGVSSSDIVRYIEQADKDSSVGLILFEINSPGGSAVASDEIVQAIKNANKPTVAWIRESGASGAYWIASATDHIIANRMSVTGSVGVIASYLEFSDFLKEHNITYRRITGGDYKDIGSPFSELTPSQKRILQEKVDLIHEFFLEDVRANRNLTPEQVNTIRSGVFFIGQEAYDLGLVDELGSHNEVKSYIKSILGLEPTYKRFEKQKSFFSELFSSKSFVFKPVSIDAR